jgi:hypothetical protein
MEKSKKYQNDFNNLISSLRDLSIQELITLFIMSKTGKDGDIDKLPVYYLNTIDELGEVLEEIFQDISHQKKL